MVGFSSASLFPARNQEGVTKGGAQDIDQSKLRTQGDSTVKNVEDKWDSRHIPDTFMQNKNNTSVGPLTPPTIEPTLPPPLIRCINMAYPYTLPNLNLQLDRVVLYN